MSPVFTGLTEALMIIALPKEDDQSIAKGVYFFY